MPAPLDFRVILNSRPFSEDHRSTALQTKIGYHSRPPVDFLHGGSDISILSANDLNFSVYHGIFSSQANPYDYPRSQKTIHCEPHNYCPSIHTLLFYRAVKRLVKDSLFAQFPKHKLVNAEQLGLLQKKSCTACITDCQNLVTKSLNA